jgi:hypothetical protein
LKTQKTPLVLQFAIYIHIYTIKKVKIVEKELDKQRKKKPQEISNSKRRRQVIKKQKK